MSFHAVSFRNDRGESLEDGDNFNEIVVRNGKTRRFLWISEANQELTKLVAFCQRDVLWWWRYVENIDLFLECKRPANASQTRRFDGRKPRRLVGSNWIEERVDLDGCSLARKGSCGKNGVDRCARGTGSPSDLVEKRKNRERKEKQRERERNVRSRGEFNRSPRPFVHTCCSSNQPIVGGVEEWQVRGKNVASLMSSHWRCNVFARRCVRGNTLFREWFPMATRCDGKQDRCWIVALMDREKDD